MKPNLFFFLRTEPLIVAKKGRGGSFHRNPTATLAYLSNLRPSFDNLFIFLHLVGSHSIICFWVRCDKSLFSLLEFYINYMYIHIILCRSSPGGSPCRNDMMFELLSMNVKR